MQWKQKPPLIDPCSEVFWDRLKHNKVLIIKHHRLWGCLRSSWGCCIFSHLGSQKARTTWKKTRQCQNTSWRFWTFFWVLQQVQAAEGICTWYDMTWLQRSWFSHVQWVPFRWIWFIILMSGMSSRQTNWHETSFLTEWWLCESLWGGPVVDMLFCCTLQADWDWCIRPTWVNFFFRWPETTSSQGSWMREFAWFLLNIHLCFIWSSFKFQWHIHLERALLLGLASSSRVVFGNLGPAEGLAEGGHIL